MKTPTALTQKRDQLLADAADMKRKASQLEADAALLTEEIKSVTPGQIRLTVINFLTCAGDINRVDSARNDHRAWALMGNVLSFVKCPDLPILRERILACMAKAEEDSADQEMRLSTGTIDLFNILHDLLGTGQVVE